MDLVDEVSSALPGKLKRTSIRPAAAFVNKDVRNYFAQPQIGDSDAYTPKPWNLKPEIPTSEEILGTDDEFVDLMPNQISGPWESKEAYLKSHYELLREDAVAPLRDAVAVFRSNPDMNDDKISIYEKVHVIGLTFAPRGLAFRIRFSTNRAGRRIAWEYSKRLVSGSIIALSPAEDAFQTKCVIAIVAARALEGVKSHPPEIDIYFANPTDADFDPQLEWLLVEAKEGYYEASRHTMTALQRLSQESFPLADHICFLNPEARAPDYVTRSPIVEIETSILDSMEGRSVDILNGWPQSPIGDLDTTQWEALEQMLTKQLAVVQGPPGTGKTYVSVIALRIMLSHMKLGEPPIIVASQTNHALDQILTHVSQFERHYVRLGARSSDPEIKKRTLFAVRRDEPTPNLAGGLLSGTYKTSKRLFNSISELLQPFNIASSDQPLTSSAFRKYGLLNPKQCESLEQGAKRWVNAGAEGKEEEADPLVAWLGDQLAVFEVNYAKENFGFAEDEVDLEYEQLKELEAEQGLNDEDDYEALRGTFTHLQEGFYVQKGLLDKGAGRAGYLTFDDMWKIPGRDRAWVYNELRAQLKDRILQQFRQLAAQYAENCRIMQIGAWERDNVVLKNAKVLGMTTTGLSKYRALVSSLKPRVVLIEEAAEAIEAPIAAACMDSLQQLILVGDHLQLRGHCSVQDLEGEPFHLDVSMFERLVKNGMKYTTLRRQRRMAPEIRQLLFPIYGPLQDHESVKRHREVPGMGNIRSFFFSHNWPESFDDMASKFNEKEAEMIVEFFVYLVLNNIPVKDITVLTFYNGQRKRLLGLMKHHSYLQGHYVKVATVDSYQGEENEVVILSLVRNGNKGIGFLSIANRVCVALSRAKRGFYMFGNADLLAAADGLWADVLHEMHNKTRYRIGSELPLTCVKHSKKTLIKDPADWMKSNGGCELACGERLPCGHKCTVRCHSFSHDQLRCGEPCGRRMVCKHVCEIRCPTSHECSCDCEESRRLEALAQAQARGGRVDRIVVENGDEKDKLDKERQTAVEKYQAYANGGFKEHDAILEQMAESQQRKQPMDVKWPTLQPTVDPVGGATPRQSKTCFVALGDGEGGGDCFDEVKSSAQPEKSLLDDW
ncbi:P-loop containing nucleoside triphosphate hydrolase protein [Aspergillus crustosus]